MPSVDELLNMAEVAEETLTETNDVIEIDAYLPGSEAAGGRFISQLLRQ